MSRRKWWSQAGSNRRPPACKAGALPAELWPQISFTIPGKQLVGLGGFEPPTSPLSGVRSNQLSYRPNVCMHQVTCVGVPSTALMAILKEVIQPQVPLRLPCYDFTPVADYTVVKGFKPCLKVEPTPMV